MPTPRPISPWWALALAPAALGIGWMAGGMPAPKPSEPSVSIGAAAPAGLEPVAGPARPRSAAPVVYSEWTTYDDAVRQSHDNGKPVPLVVLSPATGRFVRPVGYPGDAEALRWITETAAELR